MLSETGGTETVRSVPALTDLPVTAISTFRAGPTRLPPRPLTPFLLLAPEQNTDTG